MRRMIRQSCACGGASIALLPWPNNALGQQASKSPVVIADRRIDSLVVVTVAEFNLPGATAALITRDTIWIGKAGVRKAGSAAPIEITDRFHIGSNTKSFTA